MEQDDEQRFEVPHFQMESASFHHGYNIQLEVALPHN